MKDAIEFQNLEYSGDFFGIKKNGSYDPSNNGRKRTLSSRYYCFSKITGFDKSQKTQNWSMGIMRLLTNSDLVFIQQVGTPLHLCWYCPFLCLPDFFFGFGNGSNGYIFNQNSSEISQLLTIFRFAVTHAYYLNCKCSLYYRFLVTLGHNASRKC